MFFIARFRRWLHKQRKDKLWCEFREWYHIHEQAKNLHFVACPYCHTPAQRETAFFCSHCGASLNTEPTLPPGGQYTTEPIPLPSCGQYTTQPLARDERPLHAYLRAKRQQQDTADVPTQKFRTVRLERIV